MKRASALSGAVRIIGGTLRGSKLSVAALDDLRPTPQRLRETLFNWLAPVIEGARVLDLFAGSGALGIEALSRGAAHASLVERERAQAASISADVKRLHCEDRAEVCCADALQLLDIASPQTFDIVFVDPPFDANLWARAAALLQANHWLADGAYIYMESPLDTRYETPQAWCLHRQTRAGAVKGVLYRA